MGFFLYYFAIVDAEHTYIVRLYAERLFVHKLLS